MFLFDSLGFRKGTEWLTNLCLFKFIYWSALGQYRMSMHWWKSSLSEDSAYARTYEHFPSPACLELVLHPALPRELCPIIEVYPRAILSPKPLSPSHSEFRLKPQKLYITHLNFYFFKQQLKKPPKNLTFQAFPGTNLINLLSSPVSHTTLH